MQYAYSFEASSSYTALNSALRNFTRLTVPSNGTLNSITLSASCNGTWSSVSPNNMLCQVYRYAAADIEDAAWNSSITPTKIAEISISEDYEDKVFSQKTEITTGNTVTAGDQLAWYWTCSNSSAGITANAYFQIALEFAMEI